MTEKSATQDKKFTDTMNVPVFFISAALILGICLFAVSDPADTATIFSDVQNFIVTDFGWLYILAVAIFVVFMVGLALSRYGDIRLGPDDAEPRYSYGSWFAMLFSAGMGIGLVFYGVAEPLQHFLRPPVGPGGTVDAARDALRITFFHWGVHAWAIYALMGLALAFFSFRHNLPLTIRSTLYPLFGEKVNGPLGHAVDIFAVLGTMFGVATSLGLGVTQVNAGANYLFGLPVSTTVQIILIAAITLMATASVVSGLDAGIKRLSELNLILAVLFMLFVLIAGPTLFLIQALVQNIGNYLSELVDMTFKLYAYEPNEWLGGWTLFYWGWWISWCPFVGMFIARVSEGRTIREFIVGVLMVPSLFTFMWMTFFGNTAIALDIGEAAGAIGQAAQDNVPVALFETLEYLPWAQLSSGIATLLVVTFFVTSSDSGSLVIDMITSGGLQEPPVWQRVFWALTEGVVAATLLLAGGLASLQTAAITSALPFTFVLMLIGYSLWRGLQMEAGRRMVRRYTPPSVPATQTFSTWQQRLSNLVRHFSRAEVRRFLKETVQPALQSVETELRNRGFDTRLDVGDDHVTLRILKDEQTEFSYAVQETEHEVQHVAFPEMPRQRGKGRHHYRADVFLLEGPQHYTIMGYSKDQVIADVITQFERHMHFLHLEPEPVV